VVLVDDGELPAAKTKAPAAGQDQQQQPDQRRGQDQQQGDEGACLEFRAYDAAECQECSRDMQAAMEGGPWLGCAVLCSSSWLVALSTRLPADSNLQLKQPPTDPNRHQPTPTDAPPGHQEVRAALEQERAALVALHSNVSEPLELGHNYYLLPT
jgi:hypothetical protein